MFSTVFAASEPRAAAHCCEERAVMIVARMAHGMVGLNAGAASWPSCRPELLGGGVGGVAVEQILLGDVLHEISFV
ncbi:hypothetical protein A3838_15025 [Streptomyces badius]|nr:hypothetical protein A3838_15025 [Streptomyces badius]